MGETPEASEGQSVKMIRKAKRENGKGDRMES